MTRNTIPFLKYKKSLLGGFLLLLIVVVGYYLNVFTLRYPNLKINLTQKEITLEVLRISTLCTTDNYTEKQECYKDELVTLTKKYGILTSEEVLNRAQEIDGRLRSCHVIAHYMAREAYNRNPREFNDLADTLSVTTCGGGYVHGVLETYLAQEHNQETFDKKTVEKICGRSADSYRELACIHLMGHIALLNAYGNIDEALPLCESLKTKWQYMCFDGLFMEDHQKLMLVEHGIMPMPEQNKAYIDKMEKACRQYTGTPEKACWKEMAEMYAHIYGYEPAMIFEECSKAPKTHLVNECYLKGVEILVTFPYNFDTKERLVPVCSPYKDNSFEYRGCTDRIIMALIYNSIKFIPRALTLCSNIELSNQDMCFNTLSKRLKENLQGKNRSIECGMLPELYRNACNS